MRPDQLAWATVTPRKCRHVWAREFEYLDVPVIDGTATLPDGRTLESSANVVRVPWDTDRFSCQRCGKQYDKAVSRRGRNNRSRGNAIEREVAKQLGLRRVGMYGGPEDVGTAGDPFIVQVKSGKSFPERLYRWLRALPSNANQTPLLVITDAPGPGKKRRALVVLTMEDWVALHGEVGER